MYGESVRETVMPVRWEHGKMARDSVNLYANFTFHFQSHSLFSNETSKIQIQQIANRKQIALKISHHYIFSNKHKNMLAARECAIYRWLFASMGKWHVG
jgi:hypothetical protein